MKKLLLILLFSIILTGAHTTHEATAVKNEPPLKTVNFHKIIL